MSLSIEHICLLDGELDVHESVHRDIIMKTTNDVQLYR
jgi:hypothetical protein